MVSTTQNFYVWETRVHFQPEQSWNQFFLSDWTRKGFLSSECAWSLKLNRRSITWGKNPKVLPSLMPRTFWRSCSDPSPWRGGRPRRTETPSGSAEKVRLHAGCYLERTDSPLGSSRRRLMDISPGQSNSQLRSHRSQRRDCINIYKHPSVYG